MINSRTNYLYNSIVKTLINIKEALEFHIREFRTTIKIKTTDSMARWNKRKRKK